MIEDAAEIWGKEGLPLTEHYYSEQPRVTSKRRKMEAQIFDEKLSFWTDAGVFSKDGLDFGSRLLIESIAQELEDHLHLIDVGCGYGPIGLFAAKLNPTLRVTMVDINARAIELSRENARQNGLEAHIVQSDGFQEVKHLRFDRVVTNPPIRAGKNIVYSLFNDAYEHLQERGQLWIVIQKKQGAPSALRKLEQLFPTVEEKVRSKGYHVFCATK